MASIYLGHRDSRTQVRTLLELGVNSRCKRWNHVTTKTFSWPSHPYPNQALSPPPPLRAWEPGCVELKYYSDDARAGELSIDPRAHRRVLWCQIITSISDYSNCKLTGVNRSRPLIGATLNKAAGQVRAKWTEPFAKRPEPFALKCFS